MSDESDSKKLKSAPEERRRPGLRAVGTNLARLTAPALRKRGFVEAAIIHRWAEIVGTHLAEHAAPQRLAFPKGARIGATLHLLVDSGWALEVQHLEPLILERINTVFGYGAVEKLAIRQGRLPVRETTPVRKPRPLAADEERHLERSVAEVGDESLRNALKRLGRGVMGRRRTRADTGSRDVEK